MAEAPGRILVITNDHPPRRGGIESFVATLCQGLPADGVVVYTATMLGAEESDRRADYLVVRDPRRMLLPTRRVARSVVAVAREHGCDRVVFGAAMPLALLSARLRAGGVHRIVALTHGHEVWWAAVPGARALLRRVGREVDVLTYVSEYCRSRIARPLRPVDAGAMVRLAPGVDIDVFHPGGDGSGLRERLGIRPEQPVVVSASRLVARKGHDVLLRAWPRVLAGHPDAVLLIVGDGPRRRRLSRTADHPGLRGSVRLVPGVDRSAMPELYAAGDVFVLPCRTRLAGLEPEALGIVFLEAAASGLPIVVGRSGGAPETVVHGESGFVVDPRSSAEVATRVSELLADPARARAMGQRGRVLVTRRFSPQAAVDTLEPLLRWPQE